MVTMAKGFSLLELLGAVTVTMAVASVVIISVRDTTLAGQRSAVQRELQALNTALHNYKSAGGIIPADLGPQDILALLRRGVKMEDSDYSPLVTDPELTKRIGNTDYDLRYSDDSGFSYVPEGEGPEFVQAGQEVGSLPEEGYAFDPSNVEEAQAALEYLQGLNPEDPEYGSLLEALNAAYAMGVLTGEQMQAAELANYGGTWVDAAAAQLSYASDALDVLSAASNTEELRTLWGTLTPQQALARANTYPLHAVSAGGAGVQRRRKERTMRELPYATKYINEVFGREEKRLDYQLLRPLLLGRWVGAYFLLRTNELRVLDSRQSPR